MDHMPVNATMYDYGAQKSSIREIAAYGAARKAQIGAQNVFDFSLGNPSVPAPNQDSLHRSSSSPLFLGQERARKRSPPEESARREQYRLLLRSQQHEKPVEKTPAPPRYPQPERSVAGLRELEQQGQEPHRNQGGEN